MTTLTAGLSVSLTSMLTDGVSPTLDPFGKLFSGSPLRSPSSSVVYDVSFPFVTGRGANQAEVQSVGSVGEYATLELRASNSFGLTNHWDATKVFMIRGAADNSTDVLFFPNDSLGTSRTPFFVSPTDSFVVPPGGLFLLVAPEASGYPLRTPNIVTSLTVLPVVTSADFQHIALEVIQVGHQI